MRALENVATALRRLRRRPVRSLLLLQGTVWGVAVALLLPAVLGGTRAAVLRDATALGADRVVVASDPTALEASPIEPADVEAARDAIRAQGIPVLGASWVSVRRAPPVPGAGGPVDVLAGPPDAFVARGLSLAEGRAVDPAAAAPEAVVEGVLAAELRSARGRVLGERLSLGDGLEATVVGALAARSPRARRTNDMGLDVEHPVFKGLTQALLLQLGVPWGDDAWKRTDRCVLVAPTAPRVDWAFLRVPPERLREAARTAQATFLARGRAPLQFYPPIYPILLAGELDRFRAVSLALFLACLVMGAVVMANVGLLAALRRAPEIGLHRVEGARRGDVIAQFLTEGAVLSLVGVAAGWALGCGLAELRVSIEPTTGFAWKFPWQEALTAGAVSLVVCTLACLLPAMRAAGKDPVEALADE